MSNTALQLSIGTFPKVFVSDVARRDLNLWLDVVDFKNVSSKKKIIF